MQYRYTLENDKGKLKFTCPECKKNKTFTRYIDCEKGEFINENVGKCDREINCGYHFTPKSYFKENNLPSFIPFTNRRIKEIRIPQKAIHYIEPKELESTLKNYDKNTFIQFLLSIFNKPDVEKVTSEYFIGTENKYPFATVFWQIDISARIRSGKIMLYNENGKRKKEQNGKSNIRWAHNSLSFNLKQCLFGEHLLLNNPSKRVGIVESEKTALILSILEPNLIWLATGGVNISEDKLSVLVNRDVIFFPDAGCFDKWELKLRIMNLKFRSFIISDLIEKQSEEIEKKQGFDLADYLILEQKQKYHSSTTTHTTQATLINELPTIPTDCFNENLSAVSVNENFNLATSTIITNEIVNVDLKNSKNDLSPEDEKVEDKKLQELLRFFIENKFKETRIKLHPHELISNLSTFIQSHIQIIKTNKNKKFTSPYIDRLELLKNRLTVKFKHVS